MWIKVLVVVIILLTFLALINTMQMKAEPAIQEFSCGSFQSSCHITIGKIPFDISFNTEKIYTEKTVVMRLVPITSDNDKSINHEMVNTEINLSGFAEGVTMYMGKVPLIFDYINNANETGDSNSFFQTTLTFGRCSEDKMTWRLWIGEGLKQSPIILNKNELQNKSFIEIDVIRQ